MIQIPHLQRLAATTETVTLRGREISRHDVLAALGDCDREGKAAFLAARGYGDSLRYHLRHNGRSYPSKAILGAAAGLDSADFFGGARETVSLLKRLGFEVRNASSGAVVDRDGLEEIRVHMVDAGFDDPAPMWPELPVEPSAYFASGTNRPAEIAALGKVGADVGVAAPEISAEGERELLELAGSDVLVFVDSGAFSEVRFDAELGGFRVVKEITDADWRDRLALYRRLAERLGSQLYCVAPDQVGSQEVTIERLTRYAGQIRELAELGARIMVAVQKGALSQAAFAERVDAVLGFSTWIPALPCKKAATTPAEVAAFVAERRPAHVHLLGLGVRNARIRDYLAPFADSSSSVSLDSCWIAANVGREKRRDGSIRPRRYTLARDVAGRVLGALGRLSDRLKVQAALFACFSH